MSAQFQEQIVPAERQEYLDSFEMRYHSLRLSLSNAFSFLALLY